MLLLGLVFSFTCVNGVGVWCFACIAVCGLIVFDLACGFDACCFNWWDDFVFVGCLFNSVGWLSGWVAVGLLNCATGLLLVAVGGLCCLLLGCWFKVWLVVVLG